MTAGTLRGDTDTNPEASAFQQAAQCCEVWLTVRRRHSFDRSFTARSNSGSTRSAAGNTNGRGDIFDVPNSR